MKIDHHMAKVVNPFIVTGKIEPEYFCDRVTESARFIKSVTNGNNLVIISPRRMGKTGLIQFCYDKSEIRILYVFHRYSPYVEFTGVHIPVRARDIRNPFAPQSQDGRPVYSDH